MNAITQEVLPPINNAAADPGRTFHPHTEMSFSDRNESTLLFPVTERPLAFVSPDGRTHAVEGHKAIVRPHPVTREPVTLGVVKDSYELIDNRQLFPEMENRLRAAIPAHHFDQAIVRDSVSRFGAVALREYVFPTLRAPIETRRHQTSVGFRAIVWNSYDGSSAVRLLSGLIDFFCTNGIIHGEYSVTAKRHTKSFEVRDLSNVMESAVAGFHTSVTELQNWAQIDVAPERVQETLRELPGMSERRADQLWMQTQREMHTRGENLWAVVSALTFFASHAEGEFKTRQTRGQDTTPETLAKRERQVNTWLRSEPMRQLIAA